MAGNKKQTDEKELSYEIMIEQVEQMVAKLDEKELPLDEAITTYKKGMELIESCTKKLETVEKELRVVNEK